MNKNTENAVPSLPEITNYREDDCQMHDNTISNIAIPEEETKSPSLTKWGMMCLDYLKDHHKTLYTDLKLSGELLSHCHEVERQSKERMRFMMKQMVERFPISEDLKDTDPLKWVGHMNGLKAKVEEIIREDLIYV